MLLDDTAHLDLPPEVPAAARRGAIRGAILRARTVVIRTGPQGVATRYDRTVAAQVRRVAAGCGLALTVDHRAGEVTAAR